MSSIFLTDDIKHGSGCTSARVITSQLLQRRKGAEQETHEPGEYCVFMGPRECVAKAVEMLGDRVSSQQCTILLYCCSMTYGVPLLVV